MCLFSSWRNDDVESPCIFTDSTSNKDLRYSARLLWNVKIYLTLFFKRRLIDCPFSRTLLFHCFCYYYIIIIMIIDLVVFSKEFKILKSCFLVCFGWAGARSVWPCTRWRERNCDQTLYCYVNMLERKRNSPRIISDSGNMETQLWDKIMAGWFDCARCFKARWKINRFVWAHSIVIQHTCSLFEILSCLTTAAAVIHLDVLVMSDPSQVCATVTSHMVLHPARHGNKARTSGVCNHI